MTVSIDLTESQIFAALRAFILSCVPADWEVVKGQVNRVPTPAGPNYVVMWPLRRERIETNIETGVAVPPDPQLAATTYEQHLKLAVQVDFHGPLSADYSTVFTTLARSEFATQYFDGRDEAVQMLYADDARQLAFETGEKQWEDRWTVECMLQANPVTTTVQQFADTVKVGLIEIDTTYPPGDA